MPGEPDRPVTTVETAFEILEHLKRHGPLGVTDLADGLGMAKSTVHRHVETMAHHGYVVRVDGDRYRTGLRLFDLGADARNSRELYEVARPKIDELAAETDEKVWCITEECGRSIHLYGGSGRHSVRTHTREGQRGYLHQTAAGKAVLATLPVERVEAIVDRHGLPAATEQTITGRTKLFEELERIADRGYAFNREESVPGLHAVGAPITDTTGRAIGAISVSGPANRLTGTRFESELPQLLLGAANEVEINLNYA